MNWLAWLAVGVVCLGAIGCGPAETDTSPSCPDPALGEVDEACGIWVSASLGDDANPGTRAAPMASLTAAAEVAYEKRQNVYACGELWTEPMILPRDVSLYGGFDCDDGWAYKGDTHRARIETGPDQIPLKTSLYNGQMIIADVDVRAADAMVPGGSSIAVFITDVNDVIFRRCLLRAGDAADGLHGEELEEPAPAGAAGNPGTDACSSMNGLGGTAVETACDADQGSHGGKGGDGGALLATDGEPGLPAPRGEKDPANLQDGDGGKAQVGAEACTAGEPGQNGADGDFGHADSTNSGRLTLEGYVGTDGPDGQPGAPGQGGGGGGASRGGAAACGAAPPGGAGGGSGGAGGCGGKAGKGGQAGGSSFAVAVLEEGTTIWFESCDLWVGYGGDGGDGQPGQPGGPGGEPGQGGAASGIAQAGCSGGKGGNGGKGGGGAGGNGGHSRPIVFRGGGSVVNYPNTTYGGIEWGGGQGGHGGDPNLDSRGGAGYGHNGSYLGAAMGLK